MAKEEPLQNVLNRLFGEHRPNPFEQHAIIHLAAGEIDEQTISTAIGFFREHNLKHPGAVRLKLVSEIARLGQSSTHSEKGHGQHTDDAEKLHVTLSVLKKILEDHGVI